MGRPGYVHIGVKAIDEKQGRFEIFNKYYFKDLSEYEIRWALYENGKEAENGVLNTENIAPRTRLQVTIPYRYNNLKANAEYFVKVQFVLRNNMPWAEKGYVMAEEQLSLIHI